MSVQLSLSIQSDYLKTPKTSFSVPKVMPLPSHERTVPATINKRTLPSELVLTAFPLVCGTTALASRARMTPASIFDRDLVFLTVISVLFARDQ